MSKSEYIVLWSVNVAGEHHPTGRTAHYRGEEILPPPSGLQIAKYPEDDGYYLLYLDENRNELTDTYHDDVASAMTQAEWEFGVKSTDWDKAT